MSTSTDAILCYGVEYEEDYEFPWGSDDAEDWYYYKILGFNHSVEIYTPEGGYIGGIRPSDKVINKYYAEYAAFKEKRALPFRVVWHCSAEYPMYILAQPNSVLTASRGYPVEVDMNVDVSGDVNTRFVAFLQKYNLDIHPCKWIMASYWG